MEAPLLPSSKLKDLHHKSGLAGMEVGGGFPKQRDHDGGLNEELRPYIVNTANIFVGPRGL